MIDLDEVRPKLKAAVAGREDYLYPHARKAGGSGKCRYFEEDGTPSCVVGAALADELRAYDPTGERNFEGVHAFYTLLTREARSYLAIAQEAQDTGDSWGEAARRAEAWADAGGAIDPDVDDYGNDA